MISVIIATKDRPQKILFCLKSILKSTYKDFEIIVVDQSSNDQTKQVIKKINSLEINYLKLSFRGKSKALNRALKIVRGTILSFTDDDVIVDKLWLKNIKRFFDENKDNQQIAGVFGQVSPYNPIKHRGQICPSTLSLKRKVFIFDKYSVHYHELGSGNNMSFSKEALLKMGYFREWLGPGYLGLGGGEDGEMIYRFLKNGYCLAYDPNIRAFHNRWLTYQEWRIQQRRYTCGEIAFCFYYFLRGDLYMGRIILDKMIERIFNTSLKDSFKKIIKGNKSNSFSYLIKDFLRELIFSGQEFASIIKGFLIALFPINKS